MKSILCTMIFILHCFSVLQAEDLNVRNGHAIKQKIKLVLNLRAFLAPHPLLLEMYASRKKIPLFYSR